MRAHNCIGAHGFLMAGPQSRRGKGKTLKFSKNMKTKHYKRGLDQIQKDVLIEAKTGIVTSRPLDEDLPALGQYYCTVCARHFISQTVLLNHTRSKPHKRQVKRVNEVPYSQKEADAAAGMGSMPNQV